MTIIEDLVSVAGADIDLLMLRNGQGDVFTASRPVDFFFLTPDKKHAASVAGFLSDYRYADARVTEKDGEFGVVATLTIAVEQSTLLAVSGFMQCIATLFRVNYDGWGAPLVRGS